MRYIGSKDKLLPVIQTLLYEKGLLNHRYRFFDAFCGTGAVANSLKNFFDLIVNDSMNWSIHYSRGRIVGETCKFEKLGFNPFKYINDNNRIIKGFFYQNYSPGGSNRMYFTPDNAGRIDYIRQTIDEWNKKGLLSLDEFSYLIYCLIEGVSSVSNTAGVYGAYLKHWDKRSQNKLQFLPIRENLFDNMDAETHIITYCDRIENIISDVDCDIIYLDPPYTQNQYGTQYHLLETLVLNDSPQISAITGSRPVSPMKSDWSKDIHSHILLDQIIARTKAKFIILSYNNDGFMSKEFIEAIFKRYGKPETYECIEIDYKKYNNFKCRGREGHCEYLFFVEKKSENEVVFESPLNYSGSKAKMMDLIKSLLPREIDTFIDAFGGGFNVGINVPAREIIYNDINKYVVGLIKSFQEIGTINYFKSINKIIKDYNLAPNNKDEYRRMRDVYNAFDFEERSPIMLYALILFGFQQQIRFNSSHSYNVPCGSRKFNDKLKAKFISYARKIKETNVKFISESIFEFKEIEPNSFYYFDPPYRETTATYNDGRRGFEGWTIDHERRLCDMMDRINVQGGKFMFSYVIDTGDFYNRDVDEWASSQGYSIHHVGTPQGRYNARKEVLITNY